MSCYVPAYTEVNGRYQRTVCGRWVMAREHSTEPDCADCRVYLQAEADTYEETAKALGVEYLPPVVKEPQP